MRSLLIHSTPALHATEEELPIPVPGPKEVLIRVLVAGSNPKDYGHLKPNTPVNSGDDISGNVVSLGSSVSPTAFKFGDRVAAFHPMMTPHGAYAEYAIAPAATTFKIPDEMSYEEAATIPLVLTTAAVTLFRRQYFPAPWEAVSSSSSPNPLIIYGASSALGTFIIKLARASNIHPIIAIAGSSTSHLTPLLDSSKGDALIDYRPGVEEMKVAVEKALNGIPAHHAVDAITDSKSKTWVPLSQTLTPGTEGKRSLLSTVSGANKYDEAEIQEGVEIVYTFVGTTHEGKYRNGMPKQPPKEEVDGDREWVERFYKYIPEMLADGRLKGHPFELVEGGLDGVEKGLVGLKEGKARGVKFVYRVAEA